MEGALFFLFAVAAIAVTIAGVIQSSARGKLADAAMAKVGKTLGLTYEAGGFMGRASLHGSIGMCRVEVRHKEKGSGDSSKEVTVFEVHAVALVSSDVRLGAENRFKKVVFGEDIATGSREFDERVRVDGEPAHALAALGAKARRMVKEQVAGGVRLKDGRLKLEKDGFVTDTDVLVKTVREMVELAQALACANQIYENLERNAASDPEPGVRLRNLVELQELARGEINAKRASETALGDADPAVRVAGAVYLGPAGVEAAAAVAETGDIAEPTRLTALRHVLEHASPDRALELVRRLVTETSGEMCRCAIAAIGARQDRASTARLIGLLREDTDAPTAQAVASALGELGDPAAEPALVRLLQHKEASVACAAARSLGAVGSVDAVEPLRACSDHLFSGPLGGAALDAIRAIQSRLIGAEVGQLSIPATSGSEGSLSLAGDEEIGRLSLPEAPRRYEGESAQGT